MRATMQPDIFLFHNSSPFDDQIRTVSNTTPCQNSHAKRPFSKAMPSTTLATNGDSFVGLYNF